MTSSRFSTALACALLLTSGCEPAIPECTPERQALADTIVFRVAADVVAPDHGRAFYAGQALVQQSCGGCHSASTPSRRGAPAGLDFDVAHACGESPCRQSDEDQLQVGWDNVRREAGAFLRTLDLGTMPPGDVGMSARQVGSYRVLDAAALAAVRDGANFAETGRELPALETPEGRELIDAWFACGAPIAGTSPTEHSAVPGALCTSAAPIGECIYGINLEVVAPDPTWDSIYERVLSPYCGASCHNRDGADSQFDESQLDLSDADTAYAALVGTEAQGESCGGSGTLVVAGSAASSLLLEKMSEDTPSCGEPMNLDGLAVPASVLDPIAEWIDAGALR